MTDPIDIRTKKNYSENSKNLFNKTSVYEYLESEILNSWDSWGKFQQQWCNNAFNTFKDYDKYLLLIYLFRQIMQSHADKFQFFTIKEFYSKNDFVLDKINLIQISHDLKIPKETIRRKINEFQDMQILKREGKQIIFNKTVIEHQIPNKSIISLSNFVQKQTELLKDKDFFGDPLTQNQIQMFFEKYFTIFWLRFYKLQIPFLTAWKEVFKDLETWNVWGVIALNHQYKLKKNIEKNILKNNEDLNESNFYLSLIKTTVDHGVNASSIADISQIPRATVIRKLKWLKKHNLLKKNNKKEYFMEAKGKLNKKINNNFKENRSHAASFVTDVLDLIKNSKFKI